MTHHIADYPTDLDDVIQDVKYRRATLRAVRNFADMHPWDGNIVKRMAKFKALHEDLCRIYNVDYKLVFDSSVNLNESSWRSNCNLLTQTITLHGKLSVLTFLHEWGHAIKGRSEYEACVWSVNLFRRVFPDNFNRLLANARGHFLAAS